MREDRRGRAMGKWDRDLEMPTQVVLAWWCQ